MYTYKSSVKQIVDGHHSEVINVFVKGLNDWVVRKWSLKFGPYTSIA